MEKALFMHLGSSLLLCMLIPCFLHPVSAQTSDCSTALITLQPCYAYIEAGNSTNPGSDCCTPLASLFASNASCLCQIGPIAQSAGITINQTRALEIAAVCNQTVPADVRTCLSSIAPSPSSTPSTGTNIPSATPPTSGNEGSYASALAPPSLFFGSILVVLSLHFIAPS